MKKILFLSVLYALTTWQRVVATTHESGVNNPGTGSGVNNPGAGTGVNNPGNGITIPNPLGDTTITGLFTSLLEILLIIAIPIVAFFIIYAGFLYVTARGNVEQVSKAHRALAYAIIGGVLILGGRVLIEVIEGTVNAIRG